MILEERKRQDKLHPLPKLHLIENEELKTLRNLLLMQEFLAVLVEEVGEVASALQGEGELIDEIVQVASVCVRWLEQIKDPAN